MQTCTTTLKSIWRFLRKNVNQPISGASNTTLRHICKRCSIILQKHLVNYVHRIIICNGQNLETTYMPLNQRMDKENVTHLHIRVLLSSIKQWQLEFCMQMDRIRKHYSGWGNPDPKRWIWYVLTHRWILDINKGHWAYSSWS